jgi:hypothetical protein
VTTTIRHPPRRRSGAAAPTAAALVAVLAVLVALLAGRPGGNGADGVSGQVSPASSASTSSASSIAVPADRDGAVVRIELVVGESIATATLDDTPQARELVAMLPASVEMDDSFGQAKTGRSPRALDVADATRSRRYSAGDLSYWSPSGKLAIVYDALGELVPPPGLVRLGTVDAGLSVIASAGNHVTITIRRAR